MEKPILKIKKSKTGALVVCDEAKHTVSHHDFPVVVGPCWCKWYEKKMRDGKWEEVRQ